MVETQKIITGAIIILLAIIVFQLYQLVKIERADLKRELRLNSAVDCFMIKDVEEMIDAKNARENCRNAMYNIEQEFGW